MTSRTQLSPVIEDTAQPGDTSGQALSDVETALLTRKIATEAKRDVETSLGSLSSLVAGPGGPEPSSDHRPCPIPLSLEAVY